MRYNSSSAVTAAKDAARKERPDLDTHDWTCEQTEVDELEHWNIVNGSGDNVAMVHDYDGYVSFWR